MPGYTLPVYQYRAPAELTGKQEDYGTYPVIVGGAIFSSPISVAKARGSPPARSIPPGGGNELLFERYGVPPEGATYVFRPDGHVLARCAGIDGAFARQSIDAVFAYRTGMKGSDPAMSPKTRKLSQAEIDRMYDALSALIDETPSADRERVLARLCITLAERLGDFDQVVGAIEASKKKIGV
jgi:hypothetical protein